MSTEWQQETSGSIVTIGQRFIATARKFPHKTAILFRDNSISYGELLDRVLSFSAAVRKQGASEGQRVVIALTDGIDFVSAMLGCLVAGLVYVPVDPESCDFTHDVIEDCNPILVLCDKPLSCGTEACSMSFQRLLESASEPTEYRVVDPSLIASLLYTSGSTGRPKGVIQTQHNLLFHIDVLIQRFEVSHNDTFSVVSGFHFDGSTMDIFCALLTGCTLVALNAKPYNFGEVAGRVRETSVSIFHSTPTFFRLLCEAADAHDLKSIRVAILGGEPVRRTDLHLAREYLASSAIFVNGYGATETSGFTAWYCLSIDSSFDLSEVIPIGTAPNGIEHLILDEDGNPAEEGELFIVSDCIGLGYWNNDELTSKAYLEINGRRTYKTGDLVRRDEKGDLVHCGRKDRQIKVQGVRVEPAFIEALLLGNSEVLHAAVKPEIDNENGILRLHAFIVAQNSVEVRSLRLWADEKLPKSMRLSSLTKLSEFPLTRTGKIDFSRLHPRMPRMFVDRRLSLLEQVRRIWSDILSCEVSDCDLGFFDYGGSSLQMIHLSTELTRIFGCSLSLTELFAHPTVKGHAQLLEGVQEQAELECFLPRIIRRKTLFEQGV